MTTTFATSGWKWTLAILAITALASLCLRNTIAATQPAGGGGIPDSGAQMQAIVDELKVTNGKLDALQKLLESGKLQVQATVAKDTK
jgi:hypothetical protein